MTATKPILCVDFDGVLHAYDSPWRGADVVADGPVPGAIDWLFSVVSEFDVQIYSSRSSAPGGIDAMRSALAKWEREWLGRQAIEGKPVPRMALLTCLTFPTEKPPAFLTIDDRAFCFEGWFPRVDALKAFQPWNKRTRAA